MSWEGSHFADVVYTLKDGKLKTEKEPERLLTEVDEIIPYDGESMAGSTRLISLKDVDYTIRGIDHRIETGFFWVWPWDTGVRVDAVERIPSIDGRIKGNKAEEAVNQRGAAALYPPAWQSAKYRVALVKENGQWRIRSLTLIENLTD